MKLLVISDLYPPHYIGGYELNCWENVEQLRRRGHEVTVLTSWYGLDVPTVEPGTHRILRYLSPPASVSDGRRLRELRQTLAARGNRHQAADLMARLEPDLVYVWNTQHISVAPALAALELGLPVVYRLEDPHLARLWAETGTGRSRLKRVYRRLVNNAWGLSALRGADLLAVSESLRREHLDAGIPPNCLSVVPEGIRAEMVVDENEVSHRSASKSPAEMRLLFAGRLVPEKGVDVAIRALGILARRRTGAGPRLDIVGRGSASDEAQLQRLVADLRLGDSVRFVGSVPYADLQQSYADYDAVLFPSVWAEPFGMIVIQAMARGVPVIATSHGGPAEVITDGVDGLLVPPADAEALAEAVDQLMSDSSLANRLGPAAVETVRSRYTLERIVEETEQRMFAGIAKTGGNDCCPPGDSRCVS